MTPPRATSAVLLLPVLPANAVFGSTQEEFWHHGRLDLARPDGQGESHPEQRAYLHVPCHRGDEAELLRIDALWSAKGVVDHGYNEQYPDRGPSATTGAGG